MAVPLRRLLLVRSPCHLLRRVSSVAKPLLHDQPSPFLREIPPQRPPLLPPFPDASAGVSPSSSLHPPSFKVHPSFPHCFLSGIIGTPAPFSDASDSGLVEGGGDPTALWADSVKKKRKRKMNKHKYRKLRKRLRRKT